MMILRNFATCSCNFQLAWSNSPVRTTYIFLWFSTFSRRSSKSWLTVDMSPSRAAILFIWSCTSCCCCSSALFSATVLSSTRSMRALSSTRSRLRCSVLSRLCFNSWYPLSRIFLSFICSIFSASFILFLFLNMAFLSSTGPVTVEVLVIGFLPNNDNYVYYYYLERMNRLRSWVTYHSTVICVRTPISIIFPFSWTGSRVCNWRRLATYLVFHLAKDTSYLAVEFNKSTLLFLSNERKLAQQQVDPGIACGAGPLVIRWFHYSAESVKFLLGGLIILNAALSV